MRIEIKGLAELQQKLGEFKTVMSRLEGQLGEIQFNPSDPASVDAAIRRMDTLVDERCGDFRNDSWASDVIAKVKRQFAAQVRERAQAALRENNPGREE